jgi:hypothetical protein
MEPNFSKLPREGLEQEVRGGEGQTLVDQVEDDE